MSAVSNRFKRRSNANKHLDKLISKFIRERTFYDDFESKLSDSAYKSLFEKDVDYYKFDESRRMGGP